MPWFHDNWFDDGPIDPLQVERSRPVEDEEASQWEMVCQAASPGPLVLDDQADGGGIVVATLPDGRQLVSIAPVGSPLDAMCISEANTELICHARFWLLRLLRDREHARQREEALRHQIEQLQAQVRLVRGSSEDEAMTPA
ncbi:MAG: hypothetical protein HUU20_03990 [Pirellulales bacterium]|nr:hypothetical protein [Pirellulales bacterium]